MVIAETVGNRRDIPDAQPPDVASRLLLEELADLLDLGASRSGIEQEIAELTRVGLDVDCTLGGTGIALEDKDLMFRPAFLLNGVHCVHCGRGQRCAKNRTGQANTYLAT
jgi:hypothetical protein